MKPTSDVGEHNREYDMKTTCYSVPARLLATVVLSTVGALACAQSVTTKPPSTNPRPPAVTTTSASADNAVSVSYLQGKAPTAPDAITALGPDLFGDKINLYNGSFSFEQTDVELPGNHALKVALVRQHTPGRQWVVRGALGDWDLNTPRIEGMFADPEGWVPNGGSAANRCSAFNFPPYLTRGGWVHVDYSPEEYWHGAFLVVPGHGSQEVLINTNAPSEGGRWSLVTRGLWQVGCIATLQNAAGQGFEARSPEGVTYRFDWMASRVLPHLRKDDALLGRREHFLMATRVTDRHGNWVSYTYNAADPMKLQRIDSSDGRLITLQYSAGQVSSVTDGSRTWQYLYTSEGDLQAVLLPDSSRWTFSLRSLVTPTGAIVNEDSYHCDSMPGIAGSQSTGSIVHPSGATGTFTTNFVVQPRTNVDRICTFHSGELAQYTNGHVHSRATANQALVRKQITGPGMVPMEWQYGVASNASLGEWAPCTACPDRKVVEVREPNGTLSRHHFGIRWRDNEGQLLRTEEGGPAGAPLKTTDYRYRKAVGQNYPDGFGVSPRYTTDLVSTRNRPEDKRVIGQQGASFTRESNASANGFDGYARRRLFSQSSTLGYSKTTSIEYRDFPSLWVVGLTARVVDVGTNLEVERNVYNDTSALLYENYSFGRCAKRLQYRADSTLERLSDCAANVTLFENYLRGQPQRATFADGTVATQSINNLGLANSATNAFGTTTNFSYDAMGRLASITYPSETQFNYFPTTLGFQQVAGAEFGLTSGHWRQIVATGNAITVRYFDALWRERVKLSYDAANPAATSRVVETRWDAGGRKLFRSYPQRSIAAVETAIPGTAWANDGLDRVFREYADSELGLLTTATDYLSNFQTRVTSPRGLATTYSFQAFDTPDADNVSSVAAPENTSFNIVRDSFGKPSSITRSGFWGGTAVGATRRYVYDSNQRLCKTIDPESAATVLAYDGASNLAWRASGQNLTSSGSCDQASVGAGSKISYSYDTRNRLTLATYGDGSAGVSRTYTADGLPLTAATVGITWIYGYNNRRLMTQETVANTGGNLGTFNFVRTPDAYGNLAALTYPDGASVAFAPNALGEPTQVSGYASAVNYHPNGQVASYNLANGVVHSSGQNIRGLPTLRRDAGVMQDQYAYDASGNVLSITDQQEGLSSRSMSYDGLDRLGTASGIWGAASFSYDGLDNLRASTVGSRSALAAIDANNRLNAMTINGVSLAFGYDANGNLVQRGAQQFAFDIGNRLSSAPGKASYAYDANGRRTWVAYADGSWKIQLYGQSGKLLWTGHSAQGNTKHIYLGDKQLVEANTATGVSYTHTDALGSPVAKTNAAAQLLSRTRYEPYGATAAGTIPAGVGFTGHVNDADTGLVYMQQRYYDPIAGRFLSVDPVTTNASDGSFFNRYVYANNNPYKFKDPDGNSPALAAAFVLGFALDVGAQMRVEGKSFGDVSFGDAALSGLGAAITGGIGGRLATSAMQGAITTGQAIAGSAAAGAVAGAGVSAASDLSKGQAPSAAKMAIGAAGGAAGAAAGAKIANSAAARLASDAAKSGVAGHIGQTTQAAAQQGGRVVVPTSVGQEVGKGGADAAAAGASKLVEKELVK